MDNSVDSVRATGLRRLQVLIRNGGDGVPASKIVDEAEVKRWFEESRTYAWMVEQYRTRYHLQVVPSMFGNLRSRRGWQRRISRDDQLIPWAVASEHRWSYDIGMLRREARRREGFPLTPEDEAALRGWKRALQQGDQVIAYDPRGGFSRAARRPHLDRDLIREPNVKTTTRRRVD